MTIEAMAESCGAQQLAPCVGLGASTTLQPERQDVLWMARMVFECWEIRWTSWISWILMDDIYLVGG